MRIEELETLLAYDDWADRRVFEAAAGLAAEDLHAPAPVSHGSLFATLAHVVGTEWTWWRRLAGEEHVAAVPGAADFADLVALEEQRHDVHARLAAYLERLPDDGADGVVTYRTTKGVEYRTPVWQVLLHLVNHGTQFRGEAASVLTSFGHSPGDLDLIAYLRAHP